MSGLWVVLMVPAVFLAITALILVWTVRPWRLSGEEFKYVLIASGTMTGFVFLGPLLGQWLGL